MSATKLVDFLRGNRGLEQDGEVGHAQIWRRRAHVLGDIVDTQPIFVKAPSAGYTDTGYADFKTAQASRKPIVVVSAQDGMLHAFNAYSGSVTVSGTAVGPGEEMWAFIPSETMQNMKWLADPNYSHRFLIDGPISVGDVDFGGGDWHTIMVGGVGRWRQHLLRPGHHRSDGSQVPLGVQPCQPGQDGLQSSDHQVAERGMGGHVQLRL
jgi:type IV pilus assembly protein PilY1